MFGYLWYSQVCWTGLEGDMHRPLDKGLASHSSILAWRIPWKQEPGMLCPWGCKETQLSVHAHCSFKMGWWGREGGAALLFAPNGIPLELKQERWAAGVLLPANKKKERRRGFQRADELYPSWVSCLPCCVEGKEVKRGRIWKRRDKETHAQDIPGGSVAKNPCSPSAGSPS